LRGKTLMTDTITGNWAQAKWFLQQRGLDLKTVSIRSMTGSGAASLAELQLGRVDALLVNPVEGAAGVAQGHGELHVIPVFDEAVWKRASGTDFVPQIAVGVSTQWISQPANLDLARRLYAANRDVADYIRAHPADAAKMVSADAKIDEASLQQVWARYPGLIHIEPLHKNLSTVALLTQTLLPQSGLLPRPLNNAELQSLVADFTP
jgi:ABC-type nitrate/sulfonate/bicarbonate transport system substrate-binding protein